jgi:hypothetical protein
LQAAANVRQAPRRLQPAQLASALEEVAARLGIEVRYDTMDRNHPLGGAGGGFCRLRGKAMILIDSRLTPSDRVAVLAKALARFDLDTIFLAPAVRATIDAHTTPVPAGPRPLARTGRKREPDDGG